MTEALVSERRRGGPLVLLGVVLAAWIAGRAMLWEIPFTLNGLQDVAADILLAEADQSQGILFTEDTRPSDLRAGQQTGVTKRGASAFGVNQTGLRLRASGFGDLAVLPRSASDTTQIAADHQLLMITAFGVGGFRNSPASQFAQTQPAGTPAPDVQPPFLPAIAKAGLDRWSLDAWAFLRQGSNAALISQARVPVYGASQLGANLQYRLSPSSPHDPRSFVRGYRALVSDGETEGAIGVSARPISRVPVRMAAELRVSDLATGTQLRPAAYAVTELPPAKLPANFVVEAYGAVGYVSGEAATAFGDGQVTIMREVASLENFAGNPARLVVGGGAWGGAQEGANRVDVGPSMRFDVTFGDTPARISVDWRERIAGDAAPQSGLAATLSTRF